MKKQTFSLQVLTPAFVGGAACDKGPAELRAPTIRGQARWWFRALGATRELESDVFGSVHRKPKPATASSVKFRIDGNSPKPTHAKPLPHVAQGGKAFTRPAMEARTQFDLLVTENPLHEHPSNCFELACLAVRTWVLLGGMGFRANRGAGSVWPVPAPATVEDLRNELEMLSKQARALGLWNNQSRIGHTLIDLLDKPYDQPEKARADCTDTVLTSNGELGFAKGRNRQASPLKAKVIHLAGENNPWRILRIGFPFNGDPEAGIRILANHRPSPKALGGPGMRLI